MANEPTLSIKTLIERLEEQVDISDRKGRDFVNKYFDIIAREVKETGAITLHNFGTFKRTDIPSRRAHNPASGDEIIIPAHTGIKFTPARAFAERINKPYADLKTIVLKDEQYERLPPRVVAADDDAVTAAEQAAVAAVLDDDPPPLREAADAPAVVPVSPERVYESSSPPVQTACAAGVPEKAAAPVAAGSGCVTAPAEPAASSAASRAPDAQTVRIVVTHEAAPEPATVGNVSTARRSVADEAVARQTVATQHVVEQVIERQVIKQQVIEQQLTRPAITPDAVSDSAPTIDSAARHTAAVGACGCDGDADESFEDDRIISRCWFIAGIVVVVTVIVVSVVGVLLFTAGPHDVAQPAVRVAVERTEAQQLARLTPNAYAELAERHYGEARLWPYIYNANRLRYSDPDATVPARALVLPPRPDRTLDSTTIEQAAIDAYRVYKSYAQQNARNVRGQERRLRAVKVIDDTEALMPGFISRYELAFDAADVRLARDAR
ncbi:MAG: HU family DNA-binding protein [Treponema sp.]|nr:HU family DNA-binding protein [Treponema sp.]